MAENMTITLGWWWRQQVPCTCTCWYYQLQDYTAITSHKTIILTVIHIHFAVSHIPLLSSMQFQHTSAWLFRTSFHNLRLQHPHKYVANSYEEYGVLGCNTMYFRGSPTFGAELWPPPLGSKWKLSKHGSDSELSFCWFLTWIDGGNTVLQNIMLSVNYTALQPSRLYSS
jgi:hypothetical protein